MTAAQHAMATIYRDGAGIADVSIMVARVGWRSVGNVQEPGRYMLRFGWVTITVDDLAIWSEFPEATFALYEGASEYGNEYRLGSVDLNRPALDTAP